MATTDWEGRYQSGDMPWEKGAPSPGLVDFLQTHPNLSPGTVAIPGCGTGHDVCEWARAGFDAHGFALAPSAMRLGQERAQRNGVQAHFTLLDFLQDPPPQ